MKRLISFLIVAVLFVTCMVPAAFAAGTATVTVSTADNVKPGDTVTLAVSISEATFATYGVKVVNYDKEVLELTGISVGEATQGSFVANPATGIATGFHTNDYTVGGNLYYLTFKVSESAVPGTYPVDISVDYVATAAVKDNPETEEDETKDVEYLTVGDVDGAVIIPEPECTHEWGEWTETKAPTCTEAGEETRTCALCGETETRAVEAKGHSYSEKWSYDDKTHWHECTVCGDKADEAEHVHNQIIGHNYYCICGHKGGEVPQDPDIDEEAGNQTGDMTADLTFAGIAAISMMAAAAYVVKRKASK